ncbi:spike base protein, RCAP_Rcc01079 family [Rubrimonas sp.]|uniref:spike base protein, RCAP_Rcc01079 family n=1 Tax=Rubrimonas sp. TaxID=2036015 RepID=UPI002FDEF2BF
MNSEKFSGRAKSVEGPVDYFSQVIPNDLIDLPLGLTRGIFVGQSGVFVAMDRHGTTVAFDSADAQYHPLRVRRVLATGSTATGIVALY